MEITAFHALENITVSDNVRVYFNLGVPIEHASTQSGWQSSISNLNFFLEKKNRWFSKYIFLHITEGGDDDDDADEEEEEEEEHDHDHDEL